ncbi:hypothetical protein ACFW9F_26435, partial [Streptomyces sp. NPDC059506]
MIEYRTDLRRPGFAAQHSPSPDGTGRRRTGTGRRRSRDGPQRDAPPRTRRRGPPRSTASRSRGARGPR